jgi:hypothetical protein
MVKRTAAFSLEALGTLSLSVAVMCCYLTFATNDYRPILAAGLGLWVLGVLCLALSCWWNFTPRWVFATLCGAATLLVWIEMMNRGHLVIEYLWP